MSFTANIPASGQTLGNSRPQILNNFASLRTTIANATQPNHIDVNNIGAGKHIFIQMPAQVPTAIANQPGVGEGGLITQSIAGATQLFFAHDNETSGGLPVYRQMTGPLFTGQGGLAQGGTTMLFGGIILKWGRVNAVSGNIVFATECGSAFPTNCFSVTVTRTVTNSFTVTAVTNTGFTFSGGGGGTFDFMAIGN